jgi:[ribosomal protein S18]-alanine N-acetyltransferase
MAQNLSQMWRIRRFFPYNLPRVLTKLITLEKRNGSQIRKATAADIKAIVAIENKCFPGPTAYPKRHLTYLILKANSTTLVEAENDVLHGFIIVTYRTGSRVANVETIDVDPKFQRQSVGKRLLVAAEAEMKRRERVFSQLETSEGNHHAISLYEKAGYVFKKKLPGFYHHEHNGTCDAVQLIKTL